MSTRATYQIDFTTFYIHHDGYPEGAAEYFANALDPEQRVQDRSPNASLADDFFRANSRAELTEGHDSHGDTEFRYIVRSVTVSGDTIEQPMIVAQSSPMINKWKSFFKGTLADFIDQYHS